MSSYDNDTYLRSLSAARGDIDRNVANTLAEIGRQRDVAVGQTQQIGGAVTRVGQDGTRQAQSGIDQAGSALAGLGLADIGSGALANTGQEVRNRFEALEGSYGRASGLLGQGFGEQATQRTGAANRIGKQLLTENDLKAQEYISSRQAEDRDRAFQTDMMNRSTAQQNRALDQQAQMGTDAIAAQQQQAEEDRVWQGRQNMIGMIHQATLANPMLTTPSIVEDLYDMGQAPDGMSLQDFGNWLGVDMRPPSPSSGGFVPGSRRMPIS